MQPRYIRSPEDFAAVVEIGTTSESLVLDFKATVDFGNPKIQTELARDIAQFANTDGGCLLLGVKEKLNAKNLKVADEVAGLAEPDKTRELVERAIANKLVPATLTHDAIPIVVAGGKVVLPVNVPPSRHTVYLWDRDKHAIECLRRTSHGKDWLNPDELERHIMNASRATRLALLAARDQASSKSVELMGGYFVFKDEPGPVPRTRPTGPVHLGAVGDASFELRVPLGGIFNVSIPYEVVRAVWVDSAGSLTLLLSVRLLLGPNGLMLE